MRTVWLAVVCLVCVGALFALKTSFGSSPKKTEASSFDTTVVIDRDQEPLAKAGRLDISYVQSLPEKISVDTIKIVPMKTEVKPTEKATEVTSWHWHEGSKIIKRSDHAMSRVKSGG